MMCKISITTVCLVIFCLIACGSSIKTPVYQYEDIDFDQSSVVSVESAVSKVSELWGARVFEKDGKAMSELTKGTPAFFLAIYKDNELVVTITNAGVGTTLRMSVYASDGLKAEETIKLKDELIRELKRLGAQLAPKQ